MSMYCTLPRGGGGGGQSRLSSAGGQWPHMSNGNSSAMIGSRSSLSVTDAAAATFVDNLFDPILNDQPGCVTIRTRSVQQVNGGHGGHHQGTPTMRSTMSDLCLDQQNHYQRQASEANLASSNTRLYFAVDSFDDLKALRRSSALNSTVSLESTGGDSCSVATTPADCESLPSFYGTTIGAQASSSTVHSTSSSSSSNSDSAYDSSNESLRARRGTSNKEAANFAPTTFAEYKKYVDSSSNSSKYFTLPSKLGRKLKKQLSDSGLGGSSGGPAVSARSGQSQSSSDNLAHHQSQHRRASVQLDSLTQFAGHHHNQAQLLLPPVPSAAGGCRSPASLSSSMKHLQQQQFVLPPPPTRSDANCDNRNCNYNNCQGGESTTVTVGQQQLPPPGQQAPDHSVDHCCCMLGCHSAASPGVTTGVAGHQYPASSAPHPSQHPGGHRGSRQSHQSSFQGFHCCSVVVPSPSVPGTPTSSGGLETLWEETGVQMQPVAVANPEKSTNVQLLEAKVRQFATLVQSRDMEIARLKMALYTISAYGETARPSANTNTSKGWLSKLGKNSSKSSSKHINGNDLALGGPNASTVNNPINGRLLIDGLKRQLADTERRLFDMTAALTAANSQMSTLAEALRRTQDELQATAAENERLKKEMVSGSLAAQQHYDSSFTISSQESGVSPLSPVSSPTTVSSSQDLEDAVVRDSVQRGPQGPHLGHYQDNEAVSVGTSTKRIIIRLGSSQYMGSVDIDAKTDWPTLDAALLRTLASFLELAGGQSAAIEAIGYYELGADCQRRLVGERRPLMLPFGYLVDDNTVRVSLNNDW